MSSVSSLLETARRALVAQQVGLNVTGHNIANANTDGYSRQQANLQTTTAQRMSAGFLGTGVAVTGIERLRNRFVDQQIRTTNDSLGSATAEQSILMQVEATFNELGTVGLNDALSEYFQAWQEVSTSPEDAIARTTLLQQGSNLTSSFHRLSDEMTSLRSSIRDDVGSKIDELNTLAEQIGELNTQIIRAGNGGANAADLQDKRDLKIAQLSKLANISVAEDKNGGVNISVGGMSLVSGGATRSLTYRAGTATTIQGTSFEQMVVVSADDNRETQLTGGEIGGLLKTYNSTLPGYLGNLNQVARAVITEVNRLHATGYGLHVPPTTGINFFSGTDAATIGIDLTDTSGGAAPGSNPDVNNIAASAVAGEEGNNAIALLIADTLTRSPLSDSGGNTLLGGSSISQFYQNLVSRVGTDVSSADQTVSVQEALMSQLTSQRDDVSAVSLDEEMTNIIKFQRAYEAAARMVNVADDLLQTIIQMV
jgi:flagellar hook-associated protein 1